MTRTAVEEIKFEAPAWEHKTVQIADDGRRLSSSVNDDAARPKGRIRRSMTACNTCRKLKTRCDLDPRGHACRRCLSLRIECQLPETSERFQDNASMWSDATTAIPSIEERLTSLERSMREMTGMLRQIINQPPSIASMSAPQLTQSTNTEETVSIEGNQFSPFLPKPIRLIQELQSEFFGEPSVLTPSTPFCGNSMEKGFIDSKLSLKLMQLFVEHFGPWVSINNLSDMQDEMQRPDSLLYNTACLLASRYVPGIPTPVVRAMYLQVRHEAVNTLWEKPPLQYESLQALALLCLWPATVQREAPIDSWLLSGNSINQSLITFDFLNYAPSELIMDNKTATQLRLWNIFCLTQLRFAVGNARPFHIQQRYLDHCPRLLEHPSATFEDGKVMAEIQLYLITLKLQGSNPRMRLADVEYEEIERWKMEWAHLFSKKPTEQNTDFPRKPGADSLTAGEENSTLELSLWYCEILLHRTAMRFQSESDRLTAEVIQASRLIISKFLQLRLSTALSVVDQTYIIVGYAALNLCDFNFLDPLIDQIQMYLLHLAPNEDHIAYRFSCMIAEFKRRCAECTDPCTAMDSSQSSFGDARKLSMEHIQFMPPPPPPGALVDGLMEGYGSLDGLIPEIMPQSFPDSVLSGMTMAEAIPAGYRSATL
ncbi:Zn(II)2Cys6 transcription factor of proteolytic enzymes [Aspergillus steynii IBT 23096]|uniref:Transcriptional activator of proteases prtT n=1 Tax=Aspergillus steynii IBT 23096 TaxID=1392250 RepID=A0A2I2GPR4_9EURO|nr:Zn(II)2Cys6 transcription factor of proteolytic enzymes [Aspergillus steynii IBT 23096]PLB54853.1 Zn(II)2Cys6 transcription factor of proteolytic enzymes [Aspergillus steynii IBT 23096]